MSEVETSTTLKEIRCDRCEMLMEVRQTSDEASVSRIVYNDSAGSFSAVCAGVEVTSYRVVCQSCMNHIRRILFEPRYIGRVNRAHKRLTKNNMAKVINVKKRIVR